MRGGDLHHTPRRSIGSSAPLLDSPPPRRCPPAHPSLKSSAAYVTVVLTTGRCPSRELLVLSFSLTPYLWKEKLLKTPPDGDVPSWNMGSIILIEWRPLAFLSTKAWTGPSRHYTVSSLHCRRRGARCMTPPGRIVSTFSIIVRSSDHSYAGSASI